LRPLELDIRLKEPVGKRRRGVPMNVGRIRILLENISRLVVLPADPWIYRPVRNPETDRTWTFKQNQKLKQALGALGE
jgi:hypothetical protein